MRTFVDHGELHQGRWKDAECRWTGLLWFAREFHSLRLMMCIVHNTLRGSIPALLDTALSNFIINEIRAETNRFSGCCDEAGSEFFQKVAPRKHVLFPAEFAADHPEMRGLDIGDE